jgi:hypothetical protein
VLILLQGDNLVVHVFDGTSQGIRKWHGKVVHLNSLRLRPESGFEAPDTRLIEWHYNQCVRMHLRGFWVGRESSWLDMQNARLALPLLCGYRPFSPVLDLIGAPMLLMTPAKAER